jgi:D-tyrosyl-tRNA(Tyr) deacylase
LPVTAPPFSGSRRTLRGHGKGNRPSFAHAARPERGQPLYERFCAALEAEGVRLAPGVFCARMVVQIANDGPVTVVLDA